MNVGFEVGDYGGVGVELKDEGIAWGIVNRWEWNEGRSILRK